MGAAAIFAAQILRLTCLRQASGDRHGTYP